ncbi:MAG: DUF305 domain-containing protein [Nitriliruptor sp.]
MVALVAALGAGACTSGADGDASPQVVQPGAPGEPSRVLDPGETPDHATPEHGPADVAFVRGMILHHAQALRMTRLVPDRTASDDLPRFAERMDISQEGEIEVLRAWLEERDEPVPSLLADHDHEEDGDAPAGMLTEAELVELESLEGEPFDRAWLEGMLRHHRGAIEMVDRLFADGGGLEPQVQQMATHIRGDQEIEIARMETMLAELST